MSKIAIISQGEVLAFIAGIKDKARSMQAEIHQAALSCLVHVRDHGDTRGALALVTALPNGQRVEGLKAWFSGFSNGKLAFKKGKDGEVSVVLEKQRTLTDFDIEGAEATDYGSYTKEARPRTLTVDQLIKMIEGKANDTSKNTDGSDKVAPETRAVAAGIIAKYRETVVAAMTGGSQTAQ